MDGKPQNYIEVISRPPNYEGSFWKNQQIKNETVGCTIHLKRCVVLSQTKI